VHADNGKGCLHNNPIIQFIQKKANELTRYNNISMEHVHSAVHAEGAGPGGGDGDGDGFIEGQELFDFEILNDDVFKTAVWVFTGERDR